VVGRSATRRRIVALVAVAFAAALAGFVVLTGRTRGLLSSDAGYWCRHHFPGHDSYVTTFEPLPFRARGLRVGALSCQWSSSFGSYAYVGVPLDRRDPLVVAPALWSHIEGSPAERARAAARLLIGEAIRFVDLEVDESCPVEQAPDGSLRFCVQTRQFSHRWRCKVEPAGSFGCNLHSTVDVIAMCRKHGAKEPIEGHESELGGPVTGFPIVPIMGGRSRIVRWTPAEITTAALQCAPKWGEKVVLFGWDASGRVYEAAELARVVRGDVAERAALAATLLLPPWKATDGWILASDSGVRCGDLNSPDDDDGILDFNTVSKYGADGNEHAPTFAKCRLDLKQGHGRCVPKEAHPCPEAAY
jgi:hypothetical protein